MRSILAVCLAIAPLVVQSAELPRLSVSENGHFLKANDQPFFWLGDTAWELFHRLNREEAIAYLDHRAKHGFNVIQAVALAELDGLHTPNAYGHKPLIDDDPTKPDVKHGPDNDYWDHVDFIVDQANQRGIYIGFLPTWGDKWNKKWGQGPEIFSPANAAEYGRWLGERYRDAGLIWIVGGDRPVENEAHKQIIRSMALGLREGDGATHLIAFHPTGGSGSSDPFHNEPWLDLNMRQNGHVAEFTGRYEATRTDYEKKPTKPVLDAEPIYEDHPVSFDAAKLGYSIASDVRRPLYWDLFQGACGHTYGNHAVWQMWTENHQPVNHPVMPWSQAILQPGASQMQHGRRLMESRPFFERVPDPSIIVESTVPHRVPGAGRYQFVATRDAEGTYAMVYAPVGCTFRVKMTVIQDSNIIAWWFDPRTGSAKSIGKFKATGEQEFITPNPGEMIDWVLVLDAASKNYAAPGTSVYKPVN